MNKVLESWKINSGVPLNNLNKGPYLKPAEGHPTDCLFSGYKRVYLTEILYGPPITSFQYLLTGIIISTIKDS